MTDEALNTLLAHIEALVDDEQDQTAAILEYLEHASPVIREAAVWGLWAGPPEDIKDPLIEMVEEDPDPTVQAAAVSVLGRFVLEIALNDGALDASSEDASLGIQTYLRVLLNNGEQPELLRRRALESLAFDPGEAVCQVLREWLSGEHIPYRKSAAFAMGRANVQELIPRLLELAEEEVEMVQIEAIRSIADLGIRDAVDLLMEVARGPQPSAAMEAIQGLARIPGAAAEAGLKTIAAEAEPARALAAQQALSPLAS